jgi:hypothetical protein
VRHTLIDVNAPDQRPRRPVLAADIERLASGSAEGDPYSRLELAHATAAAVVGAGRTAPAETTDRMVALADTVGLDTLAELWRDAEPDSLPGALWSLYLLRTWCMRHTDEVARLYRAGRGLAPVEEVVAGVGAEADPDAVRGVADAVLAGLYEGELDVALERAAALFRIVAAGREWHAVEDEAGNAERERAGRNRDAAAALTRAAGAWRAGTLH